LLQVLAVAPTAAKENYPLVVPSVPAGAFDRRG
jgi:hypothetical protein